MDLDNNNQMDTALPGTHPVKWVQVGLFLIVTFAVTWGLNLALALQGGLEHPGVPLILQFQMLIPAAAAIVLGVFVFKDSPLHYQNNKTISRWFVYFFLVLCGLYMAASIYSFINPESVQIASTILLGVCMIGLILLIILRVIGKFEAFASINMAGGKPIYWLIFGVGLVLFYGCQTGLNWVFKLGNPVDLKTLIPNLEIQTLPNSIILLSAGVNSILIGPFLGLLIAFGEEYGWRGFLQSALLPLGKIKSTLIIGVIWGIWHAPVILMGYNYPDQPYLGVVMMTLYTIGLAFVLAYAVFKGKGIWIAAFLHALNNQVMSFLNGLVYTPENNMVAFGMGLLGIPCFILVIYFILRDPLWKEA